VAFDGFSGGVRGLSVSGGVRWAGSLGGGGGGSGEVGYQEGDVALLVSNGDVLVVRYRDGGEEVRQLACIPGCETGAWDEEKAQETWGDHFPVASVQVTCVDGVIPALLPTGHLAVAQTRSLKPLVARNVGVELRQSYFRGRVAEAVDPSTLIPNAEYTALGIYDLKGGGKLDAVLDAPRLGRCTVWGGSFQETTLFTGCVDGCIRAFAPHSDELAKLTS